MFGYADRFGNDVQHFAVLPEHDTLEVVARSQVTTARGKARPPAPLRRSEVDADPALGELWDFLHESRYVSFGAGLDALAASLGTPGPGDDVVEWFRSASKAIHDGFAYESGTTTVYATVEESIALRRGVCQDFAHVLIALCRRAGIAARYVSGYIHTGGGDTLGADASHAWAEAYLGPHGWVGIDPTNDTWIGDHFVRIATGRDYRDVSPVRGVYVGREVEHDVGRRRRRSAFPGAACAISSAKNRTTSRSSSSSECHHEHLGDTRRLRVRLRSRVRDAGGAAGAARRRARCA